MCSSPHPGTGRRPTILLGYGDFGLEALRRLLHHAALRGALDWVQPQGGASQNERTLRDLALFWVPKPAAAADHASAEEDASRGASLEVLRDLYRQIHTIEVRGPATPGEKTGLVDAFGAAAEKLLSSGRRVTAAGSPLPLGLDVIVLARPDHRQMLGAVDGLVEAGITSLADNANLKLGADGADRLTCLSILDFENYWSEAPEARLLRDSVRESVTRWQRQRRLGKPAYHRIYLVDGRAEDGIRDSGGRLEEVCLFLELLLFEGQRAELQLLFQPHTRNEPILATFGVRLLERSTGHLRHLAAALFGERYLAFLDGGSARPDEPRPVHLADTLEKYRPHTLETLLEVGEIERRAEGALSELETEILALHPEDDDWCDGARGVVQERLEGLRAVITAEASHRMTHLSRTRLEALTDELREAVDKDLHDPEKPTSLGAVSRELDDLLEELQQPPAPHPTEEGAMAKLYDRWSRLHARFQRFRSHRVRPEALKRWWPLYSVMITAVVAPAAQAMLEETLAFLPKPDPIASPRAWVLGYEGLTHLAHPLASGALLLAASLAVGWFVLFRSTSGRAQRELLVFTDPRQGRFTDAIRGGVAADGAVRSEASRFVAGMARDMAVSVRSEVRREVETVARRVHERHREIAWLRHQLREYLRVQGVRPEEGGIGKDPARLPSTGVRHTVERPGDLQRVLTCEPPEPARFRSVQGSTRPFQGWRDSYCDSFLSPLAFIDTLSERFPDPFQKELAHPGESREQRSWAEELIAFLKSRGSLSLAFRWAPREGVPVDRRFCLLPPVWRDLTGVLPELQSHRISPQDILDGRDTSRVYLLRLLAGVDAACAVTAEES